MTNFEKAKAKHQELMAKRVKSSLYSFRALYTNISKAKLDTKYGRLKHSDSLEVLYDGLLELIRLTSEEG